MITRIRINGFKSLLNTELYLGPFTCIAGENAAGKSNLFDAIVFLSHLADKTILEAAKSIRCESQKHLNIRDIFFKHGDKSYSTMEFEVDLLVPKSAEDDLGQVAKASVSALKYRLILQYNDVDSNSAQLPIQILEESLSPMTRDDAKKSIGFKHSKEWRESVLFGRKSSTVISTQDGKIKLHQDTQGKRGGRAAEFIAQKMPRTLLSTVTAESPTAFMVRQEMRNWKLLQFEPSYLRNPNSFHDIHSATVDEHGGNIPATLTRLAQTDEGEVFCRITNQLKDLVKDVASIDVDKDEKRELLTLMVTFKNGLRLPAQSLSDGTLRFIGLGVVQEDNNNPLICMEEPENGINPKKIIAIVDLLQRLAFDANIEIDEEFNPLRQIIINTHSPRLVEMIPEDSLYMARNSEVFDKNIDSIVNYTEFVILPDTYKTTVCNSTIRIVPLGDMKSYLDGYIYDDLQMKPSFKNVRSNIKKQEAALNNEPTLF